MLLNKTAIIKWSGNIKQYYIDKGYKFTKMKDEFEVKVEDLLRNSGAMVYVKCDNCDEPPKEMRFTDYNRRLRDDGIYYCQKCANKLFGIRKRKVTNLIKGKSFGQWCYENLSEKKADVIMIRWDEGLNIDEYGNKLTPYDVSYSSNGFNKKGYWFNCLDHPEHRSELKNINAFTRGQKGSLDCKQCNKIAYTHPHLVKYLVNKEDAYKYSFGLGKKILVKCPECGYEKKIKISNLVHSGFGCNRCSDGIPYPEKFVFNVLEQLNQNFITQLSKNILVWCGSHKYDFYIINIHSIVETHGEQHYEENSKNSNWKMSLNEIQQNDKDKEVLAKNNNIDNYIIIDCRKSELDWIKNSIMNRNPERLDQPSLAELLNFKEEDIDWLKCHEAGCSNKVKEVCNLWNNGIDNAIKIAEELKMGKNTIVRYLKQGAKLGWCNYDPKIEKRKNFDAIREKKNKKIICLNTKEVFNSQLEASKKYNLKNGSSISASCIDSSNYKIKYAGKDQKTGYFLIWMYYEDYLIKNQEKKWLEIYNTYYENYTSIIENRKVICLTTNKIFNSILEAGREYNMKGYSDIYRCCKYKTQKHAGKDPKTGKRLVWMYYNEYLSNNKLIQDDYIDTNHSLCKKVICLTTGEIFNSQTEASKKYNIKSSSVSACCNGRYRNTGIYPETGEKLVWMFYDEYINKNKKESQGWQVEFINNHIRNSRERKVICLTTNETFSSIKTASIKYSINETSISRCCKNKIKFAGKHPNTNEKMIWMYEEN